MLRNTTKAIDKNIAICLDSDCNWHAKHLREEKKGDKSSQVYFTSYWNTSINSSSQHQFVLYIIYYLTILCMTINYAPSHYTKKGIIERNGGFMMGHDRDFHQVER